MLVKDTEEGGWEDGNVGYLVVDVGLIVEVERG